MRSDSLTSFTVDLGPSLMTEVLSLIDGTSCLHMSNHSQTAGEEEEGEEEEEEGEDGYSLTETPVQSPVVTPPSSSIFRRDMNYGGRSCGSQGSELQGNRSVRTPGAFSGSEPVMEAERFQKAAEVLSRHYGGGSFTKMSNNTTAAALNQHRTPRAFSEEEEEIKV